MKGDKLKIYEVFCCFFLLICICDIFKVICFFLKFVGEVNVFSSNYGLNLLGCMFLIFCKKFYLI